MSILVRGMEMMIWKTFNDIMSNSETVFSA
jgi:hypothetical protein